MCVGRQIKVLGSYWKGYMSNEETNSLYLCTVRDYHALHKWDEGGKPSKTMELQEIVVDGQDMTTEKPEDPLPMSFLQHWYGTFPPSQQDTTTTGTLDVSPPSVVVHTDVVGERISGGTQSKFPHLPPTKVVVFKYWTLVSDDLIPHDRNSGQYTSTFKCNIEVAGKVCGAERSFIHCKDKTVSTTNLITHVEVMSKKCASHSAVDVVLKDVRETV
jgi:hypothetical protein